MNSLMNSNEFKLKHIVVANPVYVYVNEGTKDFVTMTEFDSNKENNVYISHAFNYGYDISIVLNTPVGISEITLSWEDVVDYTLQV